MKVFDPTLYLVTDERKGKSVIETVRSAVSGGVTMVQLRTKNTSFSETKELGLALLDFLKPLHIPLIINDHIELAKELGAQGVHLGQADEDPLKAREFLGEKAILGLSIESPEQLSSSKVKVVDYLAASPVFPTETKLDTGAALGIEGLRRLRNLTKLPLVAIGGISERNVSEVVQSGADGVAVVSAIFNSLDPKEAAHQLKCEIRKARSEKERSTPFRVLTIAGSDSGGGAGIQADLKTFQALGCYGMSALTAVTAQNTLGVKAVHALPPSIVKEQIQMVFEDLGVDAVKIGMLSSKEIIEGVAKILSKYKTKIVLDPVMVAKGGAPLLQESAVEALKDQLLPLAALVTPNIPELEVLTGLKVNSAEEMNVAGEKLLQLCKAVLVKGGHLEEEAIVLDLLLCAGGEYGFQYPRVKSQNVHGTGCTYSSAIAAFLARGFKLFEAVEKARLYLQGAILQGANQKLGEGHGPVAHHWNHARCL